VAEGGKCNRDYALIIAKKSGETKKKANTSKVTGFALILSKRRTPDVKHLEPRWRKTRVPER